MILYILSRIWKSGAEIYRDENDGQLAIRNGENIPKAVLKASEPIFGEIEDYFKSVESMDAPSQTLWKMILALAGWLQNESISNFLNNDEVALNLFCEYQAKLAVNGWKDIFEDWRQYENNETEKLKVEIFNRAVAFAKGAEVN